MLRTLFLSLLFLFQSQGGNQSSTGGGGITTSALTGNNGGSGAASGSTFNGSAPVTWSYNTFGAAPLANPTFTTAVSLSGGPFNVFGSTTLAYQANTVTLIGLAQATSNFLNDALANDVTVTFPSNGNLKIGVANSNSNFRIQPNGLVTFTSGTPTMAPGAAAGTGPTCTSVTGGNNSGVLACTTGTAPTTGTLATITWNGTTGTAPLACQITPRNAATALTATSVYTTAPTTTSWTIAVGTALTLSTAYSWSYLCG